MPLRFLPARYTAPLRRYLARSDHYLKNAPPGCLLCLTVMDGWTVRGILLIGRPTARALPQDGTWGEVTRLYLEPGLPHGTASELLRASFDVCRARGIRTVISYHDRTRHTGCIYRKAGMRKWGTVTHMGQHWESREREEEGLFGPVVGRKSGELEATPKRRWRIDL